MSRETTEVIAKALNNVIATLAKTNGVTAVIASVTKQSPVWARLGSTVFSESFAHKCATEISNIFV